MKNEKLVDLILSKSESKDWGIAKGEWHLHSVYFSKKECCACGHYPIKEICLIKNKLNGNIERVGNHCVSKFLEMDSIKIFQYIKGLKNSKFKKVTPVVSEHAYSLNCIDSWELKFFNDVFKKKKRTDKQDEMLFKIENKIMAGYLKHYRHLWTAL